MAKHYIDTLANVLKTAENIEKWQNNNKVHPLTCGNDSNHKLLETEIIKINNNQYELILICKECEYKQEYIPDIFIK